MSEIIKQIQRDLSCPVCGKKYELNQIRVKAVFEQILIIQTTCPDAHPTLLMTIYKHLPEKVAQALSSDNVLDLSNNLNDFNGDFEKIWKTKG